MLASVPQMAQNSPAVCVAIFDPVKPMHTVIPTWKKVYLVRDDPRLLPKSILPQDGQYSRIPYDPQAIQRP